MLIECPECGEEEVVTTTTQYGTKQVCQCCNHILKDVDKYAGVMIWSHKTAPEIEIHANKESANLITSASRKNNPSGQPKIVKHVGVMATRRGTTQRASSRTFSGGSVFRQNKKVEQPNPYRHDIRDRLRALGFKPLVVSRTKVPGSTTVTQVNSKQLARLDKIIRSEMPKTRNALLELVKREFKKNDVKCGCLVSARMVASPVHNQKIEILQKDGVFYTKDIRTVR